ncbi:MAG: ATP-binding cassette domain-containing protein, partial [Kineosporiaceae bacterium]
MVHRAPRGDRPAQGRKDGGRALNATVQARDLAAGHGDRTLFTGLDLTIAPGDVVGVVGANGAGKSTLLRLLAGLAVPGSGQVRYSPVDARVGYLPQEPVHRDAGPPADPGPGAAPAPAAAGALATGRGSGAATGRGSGAATGRGSGAAAGRGSGAAADGGSGGETLADFLAR